MEESTIIPSLTLRLRARISIRIQHSADQIHGTTASGILWVLHASEEEGREEGGVVLEEVGVRALPAVEFVLLDVGGGGDGVGVGVGVGDVGFFAGHPDFDAVPGGDEGGGDGDGGDVAVVGLVG